MSTPPVTETFVTGDRIIYQFAGKTYTGTIKSVHPRLEDWYVVDCNGYGESALPGVNMKKLEVEYVKPVKLIEPPSLENELVSTLEKRIKEWNEFIAEVHQIREPSSTEEAFDHGYLAGLRWAVNRVKELADKPESL